MRFWRASGRHRSKLKLARGFIQAARPCMRSYSSRCCTSGATANTALVHFGVLLYCATAREPSAGLARDRRCSAGAFAARPLHTLYATGFRLGHAFPLLTHASQCGINCRTMAPRSALVPFAAVAALLSASAQASLCVGATGIMGRVCGALGGKRVRRERRERELDGPRVRRVRRARGAETFGYGDEPTGACSCPPVLSRPCCNGCAAHVGTGRTDGVNAELYANGIAADCILQGTLCKALGSSARG